MNNHAMTRSSAKSLQRI